MYKVLWDEMFWCLGHKIFLPTDSYPASRSILISLGEGLWVHFYWMLTHCACVCSVMGTVCLSADWLWLWEAKVLCAQWHTCQGQVSTVQIWLVNNSAELFNPYIGPYAQWWEYKNEEWMASSSMSSWPGEDVRGLCVGGFAVLTRQETEI